MALYNQNMSNATTARATLSAYARDVLARACNAKCGRYSYAIVLASEESANRTAGALRELEAAGLVTATLVPCEDAEDPWYTLVATERGRKSHAKAKAAGLVN